MTYQKKLLDKIKDKEKWPKFDRPDFLSNLNLLADQLHSKNTIEGYLSSLLIYHQLCEEMIKKLIEYSNFFIQCAIFPNEIKTTNLNGKMFGNLIAELKKGPLNNEIKNFIKECELLNNIRIKIVHKITLELSVSNITRMSKTAKEHFDKIHNLFDTIHDKYRITFHGYYKNHEDWIELMNDES